MMKVFIRNSLFFLVLLAVFGCSNVYYVGELVQETNLYIPGNPNPNDSNIIQFATTDYYVVVPTSTKVLIKSKKKSTYSVIYKTYEGYLNSPNFTYYRKFSSAVDSTLYGYSTIKPVRVKPTFTNYRSSGGSVPVKGYYRKDGTYVRPHYRSSPSRK